MKKIVSIMLALLVLSSFTAYAEKPVFESSQWQDVFTGVSLSSSADGVVLSGKGYKNAPGSKFLIRHMVAYNITNASITVKFPATFEGCDYTHYPDYTYWIAFASASINWVTDIPNVAFIIRPKSNTELSVELAGNDGSGWTTTTNTAKPIKVKLGADRTITLALKKNDSQTYALINGKNYDTLKPSAQEAIDNFKKNKCYLMLGGTSEKDTEMKYTMQMTITDITGKLAVDSATSDAVTSATTAAVADTTSGSTAVTGAGDTSATSVAQSNDATTAVIAGETTNDSGGSGGSKIAVIILIILILLSSVGMITTYTLFKKKEIAAIQSGNK